MASALSLRENWNKGKPVFGAWAALPSFFSAELLVAEGLGYVCVDQQHGLIDYESALPMFAGIEARGCVALTRVPANEAWMIGRSLDAGAQGVIVPMVETKAEAARAVAACRYPPRGVRSYGPIRAALVGRSRDTQALGDSPLCFVMVETRKGLDNIRDIVRTPGLDGIYVGPADLALGLGLEPDLDKTEPEHVRAVQAILDACREAGIVAGIQCSNGKSGREYAERGFGLVTVAKDTALIQAGARREASLANGSAMEQRPGGYT